MKTKYLKISNIPAHMDDEDIKKCILEKIPELKEEELMVFTLGDEGVIVVNAFHWWEVMGMPWDEIKIEDGETHETFCMMKNIVVSLKNRLSEVVNG